jgi:TolB-like protein
VLSLLFASPARAAAHRRVAVLRLEFVGELPEHGRNFLSERLIEGLAEAQFQVFAGLVVTQLLKQGQALENCRAASCYQEIARRLGVEYLVTGSIHVEQKDYELTLELLSGRDGTSVGTSREKCELCGIKEAGQLMDRQVQGLRDFAVAAAASAPARYAIETQPAGAEVVLDEKPAGQTPLFVDVPAGAHKLSLRAPGHLPVERAFEVESGTNGVVSLDLPREPIPGDPGEAFVHRQRQLRVLGIGALAAGALAAAAGGVVLSLDHTEDSCARKDAKTGECILKNYRETSVESAILLSAGATLLAAGGLMLYLGWGDSPESSTAFVAGARGRF